MREWMPPRVEQGKRRIARILWQRVALAALPPRPVWRTLRALNHEASILAGYAFDALQQVEPIPSILFNTLPKSGSLYVSYTLANTLDVEPMTLSARDFVHGTLLPAALSEFAKGRRIAQDHLPPLPINLFRLGRELDRLVVHVRDPRQALLSWVHDRSRRLDKYGSAYLFAHDPPFPPDYLRSDLTSRVDFHLRHDYPRMVSWITGWLDATARSEFSSKILFTRFEDLLANEPAFFTRILNFYDLGPRVLKRAERDSDANYRLGKADEWRDVFTRDQVQRANELLPQRVLDAFEWRR